MGFFRWGNAKRKKRSTGFGTPAAPEPFFNEHFVPAYFTADYFSM